MSHGLRPSRTFPLCGDCSLPVRVHMQTAAEVSLASPPKDKGQASSVVDIHPVLCVLEPSDSSVYTHPHQQTPPRSILWVWQR